MAVGQSAAPGNPYVIFTRFPFLKFFYETRAADLRISTTPGYPPRKMILEMIFDCSEKKLDQARVHAFTRRTRLFESALKIA